MKNAVVTGALSGLGLHITEELLAKGFHVYAYDLPNHDVLKPDGSPSFDKFIEDGLDVLVNCAGVNRIDWLENFSESDWDHVMDVNAKGIFLMTQKCQAALAHKKGTVLNIVSNAAHMPMRCSAAYNASKGAALTLTKQLARELIGKDITVFAVSPNKLFGTGMSRSIDQQVCDTRGWTLEEAQAYQTQGLLTGEETSPADVAEFIGFLLSEKHRHKSLAGCNMPYGI